MKQQELIEAFLRGETTGKAKSLTIDGDQLVHYSTAIAERYGDKIILNYTRYSLATGKVQKMITDTVDPALLIYVSGIPSETRYTLTGFLKQEGFDESVEPANCLMRIEHSKFGLGYVIGIDGGVMMCRFGQQDKTLLYPQVIDSGIVTIVEDNR